MSIPLKRRRKTKHRTKHKGETGYMMLEKQETAEHQSAHRDRIIQGRSAPHHDAFAPPKIQVQAESEKPISPSGAKNVKSQSSWHFFCNTSPRSTPYQTLNGHSTTATARTPSNSRLLSLHAPRKTSILPTEPPPQRPLQLRAERQLAHLPALLVADHVPLLLQALVVQAVEARVPLADVGGARVEGGGRAGCDAGGEGGS